MKNFCSRLFPALLLTILPLFAVAQPDAQQNHAEIRETAAAFVRAQTSSLPGQVTIKVGEIDRRITLPVCPAMEAFLPSGGQLLGNGSVGVRCRGGKKGWTLFIPVNVKVAVNLLIANKPLQMGQVLRAEDLASQSGELAQTSLLTDPAQAIGKVLKYNIGAGQALRQDMLRAPYAVTQGQTVQLQAIGTGFSIQAEGQALNNAAEGQAVQIRTLSGQVVSGTARANGIVDVRP